MLSCLQLTEDGSCGGEFRTGDEGEGISQGEERGRGWGRGGKEMIVISGDGLGAAGRRGGEPADGGQEDESESDRIVSGSRGTFSGAWIEAWSRRS